MNEAFVNRFWPGEDPIGKRLGFRGPDPIEVVGMTATVRMRALDEEPRPLVYLPVAQAYSDDLTLHVRATGDPEDLAPSVRARLREVDRVPPPLYFVGSAIFHYLGPAFEVLLFACVPVAGVAWLRIVSADLIFTVWRRPWSVAAIEFLGGQ